MPTPRPFTVSFRMSVPTAFGVIWVAEFSGAPSAVDKTSTGTNTSTTPSTGSTGVLSQADEVIVSALSHGTPQLATNTGGFSTLIDRDDGPGGLQDGEVRYLIATATTARNDTWTVSSEEWATIIATFRAQAGAALEQFGRFDVNNSPDGKAVLATVPQQGSMIVVVVTAGSGLPVGFSVPSDSYGSKYSVVQEFLTPSLFFGMWVAFDFKGDSHDGTQHPNHVIREAAANR